MQISYSKQLLTGLAILFGLMAAGQENYVTGYVVNLKGDTIHGHIDYKQWDKNPESFKFMADGQTESTTYRPGEISGFFVADNLYRSAGVDVEISPYKTSDLTYNPELKLIRDTVFLLVIVDGEKALCFLKPASGKEQYYISQHGEYDLLLYKKFYSSNSNASSTASKVVSYNNKYVGQLTLFLTNCPGIQEKLYTVKYNRRDLQKLFDHYYECIDLDKTYEKTAQSTKIEWSVLAGPTLTFVNFETSSPDEHKVLVNTDFDPSLFFALGAAMDIIFPGGQEKWSFNNELMITSYTVHGFYQNFIRENYYFNYTTDIGATYLQWNTMARFKYPVKKTYLYANAGLTGALTLLVRDDLETEKQFYATHDVTYGEALDDIKAFEVGFLGGVGVRYNHFSGEFRYEYSTGLSPYSLLVSPVNRIFFLVGYRF